MEYTETEMADLKRDAERFRALMRCPRIKMQGFAGFDPQTGERRRPDLPGRVHFGAEFWPTPSRDFKTGEVLVYADCTPEKSHWGHHALCALADDIIAYETSTGLVHQPDQPRDTWNTQTINLNEHEVMRIIAPFLPKDFSEDEVLKACDAFVTTLNQS